MLIRRERGDDVEMVQSVVAEAFSRSDDRSQVPIEVGLLAELRTDDSWLPELSLVAAPPAAEPGDPEIIGHVVCTRAFVGGTPALGLGPIAVAPGRQRSGVGSALMHAVIGAADALDEPLIALLGDPQFYARFGFRPAAGLNIEAPNPQWGNYFQVRRLSACRPVQGAFAYAPPFDRV